MSQPEKQAAMAVNESKQAAKPIYLRPKAWLALSALAGAVAALVAGQATVLETLETLWPALKALWP